MTLPPAATHGPALVAELEAAVKQCMSRNDASHDWSHIQRVRTNAARLVKLEGLSQPDADVVDLAALLHDVDDWKYADEHADSRVYPKGLMEAAGAPAELVERVLAIISAVGFKEELAAQGTGRQLSKEAAIVQDADRLDAIGAIGIARCFTFGGRFQRTLYDPEVPPRTDLTKDQYMDKKVQATTINHFYEKLLNLKGMMKTAAGRKMAQQRHEFMELYLQQFMDEWEGQA